ncbi:MAG: hypothetical protein ACLSUM_12595 [Dysosmobacter welbionis]
MGKWTDSLTIEMLPEQYQPLAEILGVQPLLKLAEQYGGASLYIPSESACEGAAGQADRRSTMATTPRSWPRNTS